MNLRPSTIFFFIRMKADISIVFIGDDRSHHYVWRHFLAESVYTIKYIKINYNFVILVRFFVGRIWFGYSESSLEH